MRPQLRLRQQLGHADDAVHRRADFVTHVGQERTLRPIGGFGRLASGDQFVFRPLNGGRIPTDPGHP